MDVVAGGLGFIGSHLAEKLVSEQEGVVIVDKGGDERFAKHISSSGRVKIVKGDLCSFEFVKQLLREEEPSTFYHLAALASHRCSMSEPYRYLANNITSIANVLEAARLSEPPPTIIFSSSSSVYGSGEPPFREDQLPEPKGPYAYSKLVGEQLCRLYSTSYGLRCVVLRYFNVVGERCRGNIVLNIFVDKAFKGEELRVNGLWMDGSFQPATRDFTYVGDVVEATLKASRLNRRYEVINVGAGRPVSVLELAEAVIEELSSSDSKIVFGELAPHEVLHSYSDNRKARELLGINPITDIREIVRRYVDWYRCRSP